MKTDKYYLYLSEEEYRKRVILRIWLALRISCFRKADTRMPWMMSYISLPKQKERS